jgi:class 3 adenylate cyclase
VNGAVLVLNQNYEPLNVCNVRRAFRLLYVEKAEVIEYDHHEIRTAREIHQRSGDVFGDALDSSCLMRVGLHWGGSLYIGQLVPGGRLDVTALGDAVNECARIQECADPHETLASKELIERLSDDDKAALGIDPEKVRYRPVSQLPHVTEKAVAAAGAIPVTTL